MEVEKKVPEIRFKGFNDNWRKNNLSEISKITTGNSNREDSDLEGEYTFFDRSEDIRKSNIYLFDCEAIIVAGEGSEFIPKYFFGKFDLHQRAYAIINFNNAEGRFLYYYIYFNRRYFLTQAVGSTVKSLRTPMFQNMPINLPSKLNEQTKIGNYFKELDNLIINSNLKIDKLKNIKKAMLDKMFPKNGVNVPEIRFKGFDDAWEKDKLEELSDIYDGTHQTPKYTNNGIMFLSVENIKTLKSEKYISKKAFEEEFKVFPQKGDVLMTRIGDIGTANVVESNDPKAYYVSLALLKHKKLNPYFLKECISSETVVKDLWHRTLHIAFPKKINKNEIAKIVLPYPKSEKEQEKIGILFMQINNLITLHQKKLDKLKNIKKAYFKKMFVQN